MPSKKNKGTPFDSNPSVPGKKDIDGREIATDPLEGTGTVLLVDDDELIVDVGEKLLKLMGYQVLTAENGEEAIEIYKKNKETIEIVILDMSMPGKDGGETYDMLKKINPAVKVLLSSGYNIDGQAAEILARGCSGFIQKPFRVKTLSQKIKEILGG